MDGTGLRQVTAARYVVPLREGGSLPGLIEGNDGRLYVAKLLGAGQGRAALVAEVIAGELARTAGLPVAELVVLTLPPRFGGTEGDPEVLELLIASAGDNLGVAFLTGALGFDPAAQVPVAPELAATIVAFDILVQNVDRTARNPNLLWVDGALWLIDHGAALYWQHAWDGGVAGATAPLPRVREHVLWPLMGDVAAAAQALAGRLDDDALATAVAKVPADWLASDDAAARRRAFVARLAARRDALPRLAREAAGG